MSLRSTLKVLAGVFLAALGSLLLLELSARIFLFGLAGLHPGRIASVHPLWETGFMQASTHRELGYELKPWIYELDPRSHARAHAIFAEVLARFLREKRQIEP